MKAYILIALAAGSARHAIKELQSYNHVTTAHFLFGEWDIILKAEMDSPEALSVFVDKVRAREDVKLTSSLIIAGE
jgi:uncharacterized protein with GYD domain